MAFNRERFLNALLAIGQSDPVASDMSFAKFMADRAFDIPDMKTDASVLGAQQDREREEGALSKTFGWLMSAGNAVENTILDVKNFAEGDMDAKNLAFNVGENLGSAVAHINQPAVELLSVPGMRVPWEPETLSKFIQENNTEYHGTGPISGSRLLGEFGWEPDSTKGRVGKAIAGFGVDVATDPLTYVPLGIFTKGGKAKSAVEAIAEAATKSTDEAPAAFKVPEPRPVTTDVDPIQSLLSKIDTSYKGFDIEPNTLKLDAFLSTVGNERTALTDIITRKFATEKEGPFIRGSYDRNLEPGDVFRMKSGAFFKSDQGLPRETAALYARDQRWQGKGPNGEPALYKLDESALAYNPRDKVPWNPEDGLTYFPHNIEERLVNKTFEIVSKDIDEQTGLPLYTIRATDKLTPEASRSLKASQAAEARWYDKLHPVQVPDLKIPKNPTKANFENEGRNMATFLTSNETPRALSREEQATFFEHMLDELLNPVDNLDVPISVSKISTASDRKYAWKGFEEALEDLGYTFPDGKLSSWLQAKGKGIKPEHLQEFAKGKPLKIRPTVAEEGYDEALAESMKNVRFHKYAKNQPERVISPEGINPVVVNKAIEQIARESATGFKMTRPALPSVADPALNKIAIDAAEKIVKTLGTSAGKTTRHNQMTPANQANLYNTINKGLANFLESNPNLRGKPTLKRNRRWLHEQTLATLRTAETHLESQRGLKPLYWNGTGLRLSDVLAEIGPKEALEDFIPRVMDGFKQKNLNAVKDPVAREAISRALARQAMETGAVAKVILNRHLDKYELAKTQMTHQKLLEWKNGRAEREARRDALMAGATSVEASRIVDLVRNHLDADELAGLEPMQIMDQLPEKTIKAIMDGRLDHKTMAKVNKAIANLNHETPSAVDSIMMRFTTWYGKGEMIHYARSGYQALEEHAKYRAKWFKDKAENYTPKEIESAFRIAQGMLKPIEVATKGKLGTDRELVLAGQISDYFENLVGSKSIFSDMQGANGVLAIRMQATMKDFDKQLEAVGSNFRFSHYRKAKTNTFGNPADYSDNWLTAWQNADPKKIKQDPLKFLYDLDLASQRVAMEYSLIDDFVMRFGKRNGEAGFDANFHTHQLHYSRIPDDVYFDKDTHREFINLIDHIEKGPWIPKSEPARTYFKGLRMWKTGVTIYSPSHHIRNLIGDAWLMWLAGHNNPIHFRHAARMVHSQRQRYKGAVQEPTLDALRGLITRDEYLMTQAKSNDIILRRNGANLTADEIYSEAFNRGLLLDATRAEDIVDVPLFNTMAGAPAWKRRAVKPLGGKAHAVATGTAEYREHYVRLAHFSSAIEKQLTKQVASKLKSAEGDLARRREIMTDVYESAAREVRKHHPDGRDLTQFEQSWMRGIIPFYSWQRKAIPLLALAMMERPAKITAYPRAMSSLQEALGIENPGGASDPYPTDQLFPDWMRAGGIGPIGDPQSDNPVAQFFGKLGRNQINIFGEEEGYTVVNPGNPFNDTMRDFGGMGEGPTNVLSGLSGMLSPAATVPFEVSQGRQIHTGIPISEEEGGDGYAPYAASQVPIAAMLQRILEPGEEQQIGTEPGMNTQSLINLLTAAGIIGSGAYTKSAEFDKKEALGK